MINPHDIHEPCIRTINAVASRWPGPIPDQDREPDHFAQFMGEVRKGMQLQLASQIVPVESLLRIVCDVYNVDQKALLSRRQYKPLQDAKSCITQLMRQRRCTLEAIGQVIDRDPSTVRSHLQRHSHRMQNDNNYRCRYNEVNQKLIMADRLRRALASKD